MVLSGKYQLALLSARPDALPRDLEQALLDWVWHKENGIGYPGVNTNKSRLDRDPKKDYAD